MAPSRQEADRQNKQTKTYQSQGADCPVCCTASRTHKGAEKPDACQSRDAEEERSKEDNNNNNRKEEQKTKDLNNSANNVLVRSGSKATARNKQNILIYKTMDMGHG